MNSIGGKKKACLRCSRQLSRALGMQIHNEERDDKNVPIGHFFLLFLHKRGDNKDSGRADRARYEN